MSQDIINENQKLSYTNLDFSSIYTEVLDMTRQLTKDWDPSISDESDPGVILVKLSALLADKCNYNIDKSILEAFPLSVTQDSNARQLYEQLGYYMHWYRAATVPVSIKWKQTSLDDEFYTIPKFTTVSNDNDSVVYTLVGTRGETDIVVSDGILYLDENKSLEMIAYEGIPTTYTFNDLTVITPNMVDSNNRLYLSTSLVFENGVFIKNTNQDNYSEWHRVDNLYEYSYNVNRYKFGYDSASNLCYLEFPDNYAELFGEGIEITYLTFSTEEPFSNVPSNYLCKFFTSVTVGENNTVELNKEVVEISNPTISIGHQDKEGINEAYKNYKKTVGTFNTLITLRDYLNYIRSKDLNICSNAFVTDRTNDVQSVYKIITKDNGVESIITQSEKSNDNKKFIKTEDEDILPNKTYYEIQKDVDGNFIGYTKVTNPTPDNINNYSECVGDDILSPFSLKFYLLRNSLAITSSEEFNNSFKLISDDIDMESVLEGSSHLVHTFNSIEPMDENIITMKEVPEKDEQGSIITDDEGNPSLVLQSSIDDSILSRIIMIKNKYPISMNISTYKAVNYDDRLDIYRNIIRAFFKNLDSSNVDFGENISLEYITKIATDSDTRIKQVTFNTTESKSYAVYYSDVTKQYEEVLLPSSLSDLTHLLAEYKDVNELLSAAIGKEIVCKSILQGTTQLLVPDDTFNYHLNQKFLEYRDDVKYVTGEAVIDMNTTDSSEIYKTMDGEGTKTTNSYTLKENEIITLFRPVLKDEQEFTSGVHYDYNIFSSITRGQSYQLKLGERFVFFTSNLDSDGKLESFTVYVFNEGTVISPTFDIPARDRANIPEVIRSIDSTSKKESSNYMYTESDKNQVNKINNNAGVSNTKVGVNDTIKVQSVNRFTITPEDGYRFIWVLNKANYNNDLKSYTLFEGYNSEDDTDLENSEKINKYTLKSGEILCYTDPTMSTLGYVGAGTTIYRNCGTTNSNYTKILTPNYSDGQFVYVKWNDIKDTVLGSGIGDYGPRVGGLYEYDKTRDIFTRSIDDTYKASKDYYILIMKDTSGWFLSKTDSGNVIYYPASNSTTSVFREVDLINEYKEENIINIINPYNEGLFEVVSVNDEEVIDAYRLASKKCVTIGDAGTTYIDNHTNYVGKYKRYTHTLDNTIITPQCIMRDDGIMIDTTDTTTFGDVTVTPGSEYSPYKSKLVRKIPGDDTKVTLATSTDRLFTEVPVKYDDKPDDMSRYFYKNTYNKSTYKYYPGITSVGLPLSSYNLNVMLGKYNNAINLYSDNNNKLFNALNNYVKDSFLIDDDVDNFRLNQFIDSGITISDITHVNDSNLVDTYCLIHSDSLDKIPTESRDIISSTLQLGYNYYSTDNKFKIDYFVPFTRELLTHSTLFTNCIMNDNNKFTLYKISIENVPLSFTTFNTDFTLGTEKFTAYQDVSKYLFIKENGILTLSGVTATVGGEQCDLITSSKLIASYLNNLSLLMNCVEQLSNEFTEYTTGIYYMPHWYKLEEWYKYTDKKYYTPMEYLHRRVSNIPPLSCGDAGGVDISRTPIEVLKNNFASVQPNTSLTFTQNEMTVLSNGDIISVSTKDINSENVVLPIFTNDTIVLDLSAYDVSYQRNGESFVNIDKITIDNCNWEAYSNLKINSKGANGQKLYSNQTLTAYTLSDNGEITQLGDKIRCGDDNTNVHFQLKNDILSSVGSYIDVSQLDDLKSNSVVLNKLYVYNVSSDSDRYSYGTDYNTYLHFKKSTEPNGVTSIRLGDVQGITSPQINTGDIVLPTGKYLIPINGISDTSITLTYYYTGVGVSTTGEKVKFDNNINVLVYNMPESVSKDYFLGNKLHFGLLDIPDELIHSVKGLLTECEITNGYIEVKINKTFEGESLSVVLNDIFKFEENKLLGNSFEAIKSKLMNLDSNSNFNYTHVVDIDDLIEDPLLANSYWNKNHPYNNFTIPQLDVDSISYTFNKTIT